MKSGFTVMPLIHGCLFQLNFEPCWTFLASRVYAQHFSMTQKRGHWRYEAPVMLMVLASSAQPVGLEPEGIVIDRRTLLNRARLHQPQPLQTTRAAPHAFMLELSSR